MRLLGKPVASAIKQKLLTYAQNGHRKNKYVAVLFFGDNTGSKVYTKHKQKFGQSVGLQVRILGQENLSKKYSAQEAIDMIQVCNHDESCVGIMVQLPLPPYLAKYKQELLVSIAPEKDIDGLGGQAFGKSLTKGAAFMPATPAAVMYILQHYTIDLKGKYVAILGQSLLVGSPLVSVLMQQGATVFAANEFSSLDHTKQATRAADIVISCTGVIHLVDSSYLRNDGSQILIDVGYGHKNGKPVGDICLDQVASAAAAYTPIPGGVGPVTIASLFYNICILQDLYSSKT